MDSSVDMVVQLVPILERLGVKVGDVLDVFQKSIAIGNTCGGRKAGGVCSITQSVMTVLTQTLLVI